MANLNSAQFEAMVINIGGHLLAAVELGGRGRGPTKEAAQEIVTTLTASLAADIMMMDENGDVPRGERSDGQDTTEENE